MRELGVREGQECQQEGCWVAAQCWVCVCLAACLGVREMLGDTVLDDGMMRGRRSVLSKPRPSSVTCKIGAYLSRPPEIGYGLGQMPKRNRVPAGSYRCILSVPRRGMDGKVGYVEASLWISDPT